MKNLATKTEVLSKLAIDYIKNHIPEYKENPYDCIRLILASSNANQLNDFSYSESVQFMLDGFTGYNEISDTKVMEEFLYIHDTESDIIETLHDFSIEYGQDSEDD